MAEAVGFLVISSGLLLGGGLVLLVVLGAACAVLGRLGGG